MCNNFQHSELASVQKHNSTSFPGSAFVSSNILSDNFLAMLFLGEGTEAKDMLSLFKHSTETSGLITTASRL